MSRYVNGTYIHFSRILKRYYTSTNFILPSVFRVPFVQRSASRWWYRRRDRFTRWRRLRSLQNNVRHHVLLFRHRHPFGYHSRYVRGIVDAFIRCLQTYEFSLSTIVGLSHTRGL